MPLVAVVEPCVELWGKWELRVVTQARYFLPMQVTRAGGASGRKSTVAGVARRAQIVEAAIGVIAELGYSQASFARIAERAGLSSTRLISYHFEGKDELITQILAEVYRVMGGFMAERVRGRRSAGEALEAYIRGLVEFIATHRAEMRALMEIFLNFRGKGSYDAATDLSVLGHVEEILRRGQRDGEFREFDTRVMAVVVQRSLDGLPFLLAAEPDRDLQGYADELVTTFRLATRGPG
ncbi:TetR family transcriptional regulator [Sphaerisporangium sp. B11E5]|uniref:TetR/AcrR family transcriptional regulator n=1 Tax=Sphaerisporangium sp. B11E5 TaxID=3153563 RepID=UPI00325F4D60